MIKFSTFPKRAAENGVPLIGTVITLPDPRALEIAVLAGCDWLFVDCEHGAIVPSDLGRLLGVVPPHIPSLVRIPALVEQYVKQALDAGCSGIICPQVNERAEAVQIMDWVRYPPDGSRSVGIGRAHGYGLRFKEYLDQANSSTAVIVQIESATAVENLDEILKVAGISGVLIGPYDLSGSLGIPGDLAHPLFQAKVKTILEKCQRRGMPVGQFFASAAGYKSSSLTASLDFVAVGIDTMLLAQSIEDIGKAIRNPGQ